jgi:hypothetical protein
MFEKTIILTADTDSDTLKKVAYVVRCLNEHPITKAHELEWKLNAESIFEADLRLEYGNLASCNIKQQNLLFGEKSIDYQQLTTNEYLTKNQTIYSVETDKKAEQDFCQVGHDGRVQFAFDWIEALFFHWSRVEEYHLPKHAFDDFGIAKSKYLFLPRHRLQQIPVVDQLTVAVYRALDIQIKPSKTKITLTHDADHLHRFPSTWSFVKYCIKSLLKRQLLLKLPGAISDFNNGRDPYHTYEWLLSKRTDIEKVIYWPSGKFFHPQDPTFQYTDPRGEEAITLAKQLGYAFGLHPRINTFKDAKHWKSEKAEIEAQIGEPLQHTRQHFLQFSLPETADILEQSDIKNDSSLGYRDLIGFRCGTGFPYPLYNFAAGKPYNWLETPLVVMDIALLRDANFDNRRVESILRGFMEKSSENTQITLLFHNSVFQYAREQGVDLEGLYRQIAQKPLS